MTLRDSARGECENESSVELVEGRGESARSGRRSRFKNRANFIDSGELFFARC